MRWQLRRPQRWFNMLLFYTGWLALLLHLVLIVWFSWQQMAYPLSWWLTALAPALCVLWGGVPALQIQGETARRQTGLFRC